ncbi:MAG: hypothetical protein WDM96_01310 [Lacunisphaera sp.]
MAFRLAEVIGTRCGELSLGTLELTAILKEALVAPASIVAKAKPASLSSMASAARFPLVVSVCMLIAAGAAALRMANWSRRSISSFWRSATGLKISRFHTFNTGAAPPSDGRAVESVSITSFQSSPVAWCTRPK